MSPNLVIRGGFVVDGSGRHGFEADVVAVGDRTAGVGRYDGPADEVIDARGTLVTPGFIDIHTHLDAQITWDPLGAPSCFHGVTSVVRSGTTSPPRRATSRSAPTGTWRRSSTAAS
jgi:N-acyl-D-amino-acid deacylase